MKLAQPKPDIDVILFENAADKSHDPMPRFAAARVEMVCSRAILFPILTEINPSNAAKGFLLSSYTAAASLPTRASASSAAPPMTIRTSRPARSTFRRRVFRALNG